MGGYETLRPEQGRGDGGDADYLGFRSRWESTEIRDTGPLGPAWQMQALRFQLMASLLL